jgi:four helix bundle protein
MSDKTVKVTTHKDLEVWKKAMDFVIGLYKTTVSFPDDERYGLTSQLRRAAVSIPSNIAEGAARQSNKEFIQFLYIALGSTVEIETQLNIARNLNFIKADTFEKMDAEQNEISRMLMGLIKYRKTRI